MRPPRITLGGVELGAAEEGWPAPTQPRRPGPRGAARGVETVYVVTDLGPTDLPGLVVPAQMLGPHINGTRIFYYDPS